MVWQLKVIPVVLLILLVPVFVLPIHSWLLTFGYFHLNSGNLELKDVWLLFKILNLLFQVLYPLVLLLDVCCEHL
jgi:hypothetical protein